MREGRALILGLIIAFSSPALGRPFEPPGATNGECKAHWRGQGFSAEAEEAGLRTLFDPKGPERYTDFYRRLERAKCYKEWLVVVYMAGDNDLSPFSYRDIWEMEAAGSAVSVDTVVFHVSAREKGARYYHISKNHEQEDYREEIEAFLEKNPNFQQLEAKEQEVAWLHANGQRLIGSPVVRRLDEADPAAKKSLEDFLDWAFTTYPSRRVLFLGWGHGKGYEPAHGGSMAVTDMVAVLEAKLAAHRGRNPMDIAGTDSCLNQQVDYGLEWLGRTDFLFGSSTIVQKKGFNYRVLLNWFNQRPYFETEDAAKEIPVLYRGSVTSGAGKKYSSYYDPYATMGVWETRRLPGLKTRLDNLGLALSAWLGAASDPLDRIERRKAILAEVAKIQRLGGVAYDLHIVLQVLKVWAQLTKAATPDAAEKELLTRINTEAHRTLGTLNSTVVASHVGSRYVQPIELARPVELESAGASIWIPASSGEATTLLPQFREGRFHRGEGGPSAWSRFVAQLFGKE